jgi:soluble lytic murein transglycosylase-like protein
MPATLNTYTTRGRASRRLPHCRTASLILVAALAALTGAAAEADIYKYVDPQGGLHLADRPLGPGYVLILRSPGNRARRSASARLARNRSRYGPIVDRVARYHRLDSALVHAVVQVESAYNPTAVSGKGAVGLMQLMPETARRYGVRDRRDPERNLHGGVRYLRDLILRFNDVVLALAAYNAGEGAVIRYGKRIPPFPETQQYVRKVLVTWRALRGRNKARGG